MRIPPPSLPEPDPLCLIDVDENGNLPRALLPRPPVRDRCPVEVAEGQSVEAFNEEHRACMIQKGLDEALADKRGQAKLDKERNYRQACVRYIREIRSK